MEAEERILWKLREEFPEADEKIFLKLRKESLGILGNDLMEAEERIF